MRVLALVDGEKWTGAAAVAFDQTSALVASGIEAQFAFVADSPLARRLLPLGWARPLLRRPRDPIGYALEVRRLAETVRRERFDLVHAHRSYDHFLAALALRGTRARLVRTLHHVRYATPDPFARAFFRRTDAFAYANAEIARRFGRSGPVLFPVVDPRRFHPGPAPAVRERLGLPRERFLVGTVGKVSRGRGHEEAIRALARLPERIAMVHVGHGEHMPALRRIAASAGVGERTSWVGYQEEALPDLYRAFDAFLLPASGSDQGQRAILEAFASGVPVVALDVPGVRDLFEGAAAAPGRVARTADEFAGAIAEIERSDEERRAMALAARSRALDFAPEKFAPGAVAFYEEVLAAGSGAPKAGGLTSGRRAPLADASSAKPSDRREGSGRPGR